MVKPIRVPLVYDGKKCYIGMMGFTNEVCIHFCSARNSHIDGFNLLSIASIYGLSFKSHIGTRIYIEGSSDYALDLTSNRTLCLVGVDEI